jgi:Protein of unknown function (DUF3223)
VAKSVRLSNGRDWHAQTAALEHFKEILNRYRRGDRITAASDHSDLTCLVQAYDTHLAPGQASKSGAGISYFTKELNVGDGWATEGFHVHRTDSTSIDFSYIEAVKSVASKRP